MLQPAELQASQGLGCWVRCGLCSLVQGKWLFRGFQALTLFSPVSPQRRKCTSPEQKQNQDSSPPFHFPGQTSCSLARTSVPYIGLRFGRHSRTSTRATSQLIRGTAQPLNTVPLARTKVFGGFLLPPDLLLRRPTSKASPAWPPKAQTGYPHCKPK